MLNQKGNLKGNLNDRDAHIFLFAIIILNNLNKLYKVFPIIVKIDIPNIDCRTRSTLFLKAKKIKKKIKKALKL